MTEPIGKRSAEQDRMAQIREGMDVFDRDEKRVGRVASLYLGAEADGTWSGTAPATPAGAEGTPDDRTPVLGTPFLAMTDEDDVPPVLRKRLQQQGYIRIDRGLLGRDCYATRDQIAAVGDKRVDLNVAEEELPRR
jgi:hypothetical protein